MLTKPTLPVVEPKIAGAGGSDAEGSSSGSPLGVAGGIGQSTGNVTLAGEPGPPLIMGGDVKAPSILHRVDPHYPTAMVRLRKQGMVIVECVIDREGRVREAHVLRSPHPMFDDAAIDAVKQWRFGPGTLNGRPVDVTFVLTVNFQLR